MGQAQGTHRVLRGPEQALVHLFTHPSPRVLTSWLSHLCFLMQITGPGHQALPQSPGNFILTPAEASAPPALCSTISAPWSGADAKHGELDQLPAGRGRPLPVNMFEKL